MSDWNPEHISAWETDRASSKEIDADDTELTRRAAAIRARDERIATLEAALREITNAPAYRSRTPALAIDWLKEAEQIARAALAGEEQK